MASGTKLSRICIVYKSLKLFKILTNTSSRDLKSMD